MPGVASASFAASAARAAPVGGRSPVSRLPAAPTSSGTPAAACGAAGSRGADRGPSVSALCAPPAYASARDVDADPVAASDRSAEAAAGQDTEAGVKGFDVLFVAGTGLGTALRTGTEG